MKVEVRGRKLSVSEAMRAYAERRLRFALGRLGAELRSVRVRLDDVNGPRGGVDKRCTVEISGPRLGTTFVDAVDADVYAAMDHAAQAASRSIKTAIHRSRAARAPLAKHARAATAS